MKKFLVLVLLAACGPSEIQTINESESSRSALASTLPRRGMWVYGPNAWVANTSEINKLIALSLRNGVNEIYLSSNYALIASPALPAFIERMSNNGIAVEALIGKASWGTASGHADMVKQLEMLTAYNQAQPYVRRYKSVHLDVEPWIGTGADTRWVVPLLSSFKAAATALAGSGMKLSVDLSGSKVVGLDLATRQAFVSAVDKAVLMQYEATEPVVVSRTQRFLSGVSVPWTKGVVVAVRMFDFSYPEPAGSTLSAVDGALRAAPGYRGWALYHYADLL